MKDKLMNSLKRRRKHKDSYERLGNESLEKRLAFNAAPMLTDADSILRLTLMWLCCVTGLSELELCHQFQS